MTKILIAGSTGFVGQNLTPYLEKSGFEIWHLNRNNTPQNGYTWKDLEEIPFSEFEGVIHLAGKAHDLKKTADDNVYYEINTELTKRLFNQVNESECPTFIQMSSVKAAADTVKGKILTEEDKAAPQTVYGKSKLAAEQYLLEKNTSKNLYLLRPCMIHGPGNKGNLNLLYKFVSKGIPYPLGLFNNQRSFLSVENLCFIIKQLIEKKPASGIYQMADDGSLSTNELIQVIGKALNKRAKIWNTPKGIIKFLAAAGDILHLPLNTERLNKLTENYVVSNAKIKTTLNSDLPVGIEAGLMKTIKSFDE